MLRRQDSCEEGTTAVSKNTAFLGVGLELADSVHEGALLHAKLSSGQNSKLLEALSHLLAQEAGKWQAREGRSGEEGKRQA